MKKKILYFFSIIAIAIALNTSFGLDSNHVELDLIQTAHANTQSCSRKVSIKILGTGIEHECSVTCSDGETAKCGLFRCRCI